MRLSLSLLGYALTTIYLPVWIPALCTIVFLAADTTCMHYMRALDPKRHVQRYRLELALNFVRELSFTLPAALIWQSDALYAQPFAVGIIMSTLMQLISARTIHIPFGYAGLAAAALTSLVGNSVHWIKIGDLTGLFLSTVAALAVLSYTIIAMRSNHRLHSESARDRKSAQASNLAKTRFLAQMSHELRTPLNAILGMGHAEHRRSTDTLSQNRLSVLIASAEGLSTILDDILDMSAVEAGRLPIRPKAANPQQEIAATLALFQPGITEAGLRLTHFFASDVDSNWMLDTQRLRQCLTNLLSNAVKNTAQGSIHVAAEMISSSEKPPLLLVEISDTGPGIPDEMHRSLFEPFSRPRKPRAGTASNGLGLSISRTMARQMGGDLTIAPNSDQNSGARFILTLQLAPVSATDALALPAIPAASPENPCAAGLVVLVVDDIATNRLVASTYLRMLGATMIEADGGAQALDILTQTRPDLVLLDLNMPEMDGLQTLGHIRASSGPAAALPVIAMTADAMPNHRSLYLSSGFDGYLAKPVTPARIEAEIKAVLDKCKLAVSD
jgi:signal transduction histidine kinase/ActR/RegA family two-component response regulator